MGSDYQKIIADINNQLQNIRQMGGDTLQVDTPKEKVAFDTLISLSSDKLKQLYDRNISNLKSKSNVWTYANYEQALNKIKNEYSQFNYELITISSTINSSYAGFQQKHKAEACITEKGKTNPDGSYTVTTKDGNGKVKALKYCMKKPVRLTPDYAANRLGLISNNIVDNFKDFIAILGLVSTADKIHSFELPEGVYMDDKNNFYKWNEQEQQFDKVDIDPSVFRFKGKLVINTNIR